MSKAIVCVGISASGKSTFAKEMVDQGWVDVNKDWIRFNVLSPDSNWSTYKFSRKKENEVTEIQKEMIVQAFYNEQNVIVSDTNLNEKTRNSWIEFLKEYDFEVEIKEFPISLEEAYKRDNLRVNGVGQSVIYSQYQKWLDYKERKTYTPDASLPKAVIFDVDGTLASMNDRGPFEWERVSSDSPKEFVVQMAKVYNDLGYCIIVMSGRDSVCFDDTEKWLKQNEVPYWYLLMRGEGDSRKDSVIKEELFWKHVADRYNVVACVDDRPQMIRLWHELKIPNVIAVANPYVEF